MHTQRSAEAGRPHGAGQRHRHICGLYRCLDMQNNECVSAHVCARVGLFT